jgi:hypothetical protein
MVVRYSQMIATFYELDRTELFILVAAAWFHDVGQLFRSMLLHEEVSVIKWQDYSNDNMISLTIKERVSQCILATKYPPLPSSLLEQIICDADTFHFATVYFRETDALIRQEHEIRTNKKVPGWINASIRLLQTHKFYTPYCQALLDNGKMNNIHWLQSLLKNEEPDI